MAGTQPGEQRAERGMGLMCLVCFNLTKSTPQTSTGGTCKTGKSLGSNGKEKIILYAVWKNTCWPREHRGSVRGVNKMCVPCYLGCQHVHRHQYQRCSCWEGGEKARCAGHYTSFLTVASSVTHRAWEGTVAMADSAHSLVMIRLSPGAAEAVKPGEWKSRKEKVSVADSQGPRSP